MSYIPTGTFGIISKTANYTVLLSDYIVKGDTTGGAFTLTLFTAVGNAGKELILKNLGTSNLTIDGASTELIDGALTKVLTNKYASINIISDNVGWMIV
jgi:hypothetical protein